MKSRLFFILIFGLLGLFIAPNTENVLADHGSSSSGGAGGGGGCGDCFPPTLGIDNAGNEYVKEGFSINGVGFKVSNFKQEIPTQILKTGEKAVITLKIYENTGPKYLAHAAIMLGLEEQTISGVRVQAHPVQIIWEKTWDGIKSVTVKDENNFVTDVEVTDSLASNILGDDENLVEIKFEFIPTKPFDADPILVKVWDIEKNAWTNYFYHSIKIEESGFLENPASQGKVPDWFKVNAGFWTQNQIDDQTFSSGIKYLIENNIMNIPNLQRFEPKPLLHFIDTNKGIQHYIDRYYNDRVYQEWFDENFPEYTIEEAVGLPLEPVIPEWVKNNAELWTNEMITDKEFLAGIQFLIENGIIQV